jgi:hypothetical protein
MLLSMHIPEIKTELTPPNVFERLAGMRFVYATTIADDVREVVGRGPTPEASHEAAQTQWISRWGESPVERGTARGGGTPAHSFHSEPRGRGVCQSRF